MLLSSSAFSKVQAAVAAIRRLERCGEWRDGGLDLRERGRRQQHDGRVVRVVFGRARPWTPTATRCPASAAPSRSTWPGRGRGRPRATTVSSSAPHEDVLEHLWIRNDRQPVCVSGSRLDVHRLERRRLPGVRQVRCDDELPDQSATATFASNQTLICRGRRIGAGTVTGSGITCPSACSSAYAPGTMVTLTATANTGSTFTGWSGGGCSGTGHLRGDDELGSERDRDLCFEPGDVDGRGRRVGFGHRHGVGHLLPGNLLEPLLQPEPPSA